MTQHIIDTDELEKLPRYEQDKFLVRYEDVVKLIANSPQADGMVLVPSEPNNVAYHEVVDALIGMVWQYLEDDNGFIDHSFMSAGENAECVLERLGIVKEGKIIDKFEDDGEVKLHIEAMLSAYKPQADDVRKDAWISVEDTPIPKNTDSFLVANLPLGLVAPYVNKVIQNNVGTNWDWQYGEAITHWQPLPSPPLDKARE